jgi:hypothetical protein
MSSHHPPSRDLHVRTLCSFCNLAPLRFPPSAPIRAALGGPSCAFLCVRCGGVMAAGDRRSGPHPPPPTPHHHHHHLHLPHQHTPVQTLTRMPAHPHSPAPTHPPTPVRAPRSPRVGGGRERRRSPLLHTHPRPPSHTHPRPSAHTVALLHTLSPRPRPALAAGLLPSCGAMAIQPSHSHACDCHS